LQPPRRRRAVGPPLGDSGPSRTPPNSLHAPNALERRANHSTGALADSWPLSRPEPCRKLTFADVARCTTRIWKIGCLLETLPINRHQHALHDRLPSHSSFTCILAVPAFVSRHFTGGIDTSGATWPPLSPWGRDGPDGRSRNSTVYLCILQREMGH